MIRGVWENDNLVSGERLQSPPATAASAANAIHGMDDGLSAEEFQLFVRQVARGMLPEDAMVLLRRHPT